MTRVLPVLFALVISTTAAASEVDELRARALGLVEALRIEVGQSPDPDRLRDAIAALNQARAQLAVDPRTQCIRWSKGYYDKITDSSNALRRATAICEGPVDQDVFRMAFDTYSQATDTNNALSRARPIAIDPALRGKTPVLQFVFAIRMKATDRQNAFNRACRDARKLPASSLPCLRLHFEVESGRTDASNALDRSIDQCD